MYAIMLLVNLEFGNAYKYNLKCVLSMERVHGELDFGVCIRVVKGSWLPDSNAIT